MTFGMTKLEHKIGYVFLFCWRLFFPVIQLVFITEYITSGSLEQFLKKTKGTKGTNSISDKVVILFYAPFMMHLDLEALVQTNFICFKV